MGAERAAVTLQQFALEPDSTPDVAEMLSIAGYTYVYFAEDFCSGVPFSRINGDSLVFGTPQTTTQMLDTALARFDSALAHPGLVNDDGTITNLAMVGRGRALLDLGLFTEAAAAVSAVPTEYQYVTEHSDSPLRLQNAIWSYTDQGLWWVSDQEGGVGLPYISALDPRVPVDSLDEDGNVLAIQGLRISLPPCTRSSSTLTRAAPVPLADGTEARLIEAEAQLQAGDRSGMTTTLNDLRQSFPDFGLANLSTPGTSQRRSISCSRNARSGSTRPGTGSAT